MAEPHHRAVVVEHPGLRVIDAEIGGETGWIGDLAFVTALAQSKLGRVSCASPIGGATSGGSPATSK